MPMSRSVSRCSSANSSFISAPACSRVYISAGTATEMARAMSAALLKRRKTLRCSAVIIASDSARGTPGLPESGEGISSRRIPRKVSSSLSSRESSFPVSSSCSAMPAEKMSLRASSGAPRACSGDM